MTCVSRRLLAGWAAVLFTAVLPGCGVPVSTHPSRQSQSASVARPSSSASPLADQLLARAAHLAATEAYRASFTARGMPGFVQLQGTWAIDPRHRQRQLMVQETLGASNAGRMTVTVQFIAIGNHVWLQTIPPGGWRSVSQPPSAPFPVADLTKDYIDIQSLPDRMVDGRLTAGVSAMLNVAGLALLEQPAPQTALSTGGLRLHRVRVELWIGRRHGRLRLATVTESGTAQGHSFTIVERLRYFDWGQSLSLRPPTG